MVYRALALPPFVLLLWILLWLSLAMAPATLRANSPQQLQAWESWILADQKEWQCPYLMTTNGNRVCHWPGRLVLDLLSDGLRFELTVDVYRDQTAVALPGHQRHWPTSVTLNDRQAQVVDRGGWPRVFVDKGRHRIEGRFQWRRQPASLKVPEDIALVSLRREGEALPVNRAANSVLFSAANIAKSAKQRDRLRAEVYRRFADGVPSMLETRVKLSVSGKPREVRLGQLAWQGTEVISINSSLPARIEEDGDLRVQVRAGEHQVKVTSRLLGDASEIRMLRRGELWPMQEYLSFKPDPQLRQARLSGAPSVDTSQVSLPREWVNLPTYRLDANTPLQIMTEFRGDHLPAANRLQVERALWLDFDGDGLTGLEQLTGAMHRDWRLNSAADTEIGRASVGGRAVLITDDKGKQGLEVRSPTLDVSAVTRVENPSDFSTLGWQHPADQFSAVLHIPPGWRVLNASGVDSVRGSWISQWDLWDIFLVLIIIAASRKLLGNRAALLAALALAISFHEKGAPIAPFALLLLLMALLPVVSGALKRSLSTVAAFTGAVLVVTLIAFAVSSFRLAIYPTLEKASVGRYQVAQLSAPVPQSPAEFKRSRKFAEPDSALDFAAEQEVRQIENMASAKRKSSSRAIETQFDVSRPPLQLYQLDDNDRVQTGPGQPSWLWKRVTLSASGPVAEDERLNLMYSPPWLTSLWRVLSVLLTGLYAALILMRLVPRLSFSGNAGTPATTAAAILLATVTLSSPTPVQAQQSDYPPAYLMEALKQRVLQPPACLPHCLSLDQGSLTIEGNQLVIQFQAFAEVDSLLKLPTGNNGWQTDNIRLNGDNTVAIRRQAHQLAMRLPKGRHLVTLSGPLSGDQVAIMFPQAIHNFRVHRDQWRVEGLVDGRIPSQTLMLRSPVTHQQKQADTLIPDPVKPFVVVQRVLHLDKRWRMQTFVRRIAPKQGPFSVSVPLWKNERPLSDDVHFEDGVAKLQFSGSRSIVKWQSDLNPEAQLVLNAAQDPGYVETWLVRPSSLWRVEHSGIPPIKSDNDERLLEPTWKPWPGEQLTLDISRPRGIEGPTHTVESAKLDYHAGNKLQKSNLTLSIRSSLGEDFLIELPQDAEVLSLKLQGQVLNRPTDHLVKVPLQPGIQELQVEFQQPIAMGSISQTPQIRLPGGAANIDVHYHLPRDRWPLYISGPAIGPAMLYWGVLCVILLGALILPMLARHLELPIPVTLLGWLLLGLGLSTVNSYGVVAVAVFFFLLAWRAGLQTEGFSRLGFNLLQVVIAGWTLLTLALVIGAIPMGLLSSPDMKVVGNNSWSHLYRYYQDHAGADDFPRVMVVSVSLFLYRIVMLVWSLWLATRLIEWAGWWWRGFSAGESWRGKNQSAV